MGTTGTARLDVALLGAIAGEYQAASLIVDTAVRSHLGGVHFSGASAGRAYVDQGEALRSALDDVVTSLRHWSRAAAEIATALQVSAESYRESDARGAERVG